MKKLAIYLSIIVALFALLFIVDQQSKKKSNTAHAEEALQLYQTTPDKLDPATVKQLSDPHYQNIILPNDLKDKLDNKEDVYVYFFDPTCSFCVISTPKINAIAEEAGVDVVQFNMLEFGTEARAQYAVSQTPTLVYFKDGQIRARNSMINDGFMIEGGFSGNKENDAMTEAVFKQFFATHEAARQN